ncbi:hypothetical protein [Streptomyces sp. Ac-502]|uniref:hypothetical protein n=1 Tax=Streptomyces sp. Ac-502 TaxID=3342801 RepID=UPI003862AE8E
MGHYLTLFRDWTPAPSPVPTHHIQATELTLGQRSQWPVPHTATTVPGDHFSLLSTDAHTTAQAIRASLRRHATG